MADRVGQQLGNYRLVRLLGKGGFAEVYLGEHVRLRTLAAIKVLLARLASAEEIEGFQKEAETVAHLVHPHIVRVLDFDVVEETPFLVLDYAPGGTLRQRHARGTRLSLEEVLPYVQQVSGALHFAHERRLIHRDIKPENLLVGGNGQVLLSDFGISTITQSSRYENAQDVAGTAAYMAPEQLQGHPQRASDQYALGIVIYEWLTGSRPFQGTFTELYSQQLFMPPRPLREQVPMLSPGLEQVVLTALEKDPKSRFASMQAFATAFDAACRSARLMQMGQPSAPAVPPAVQPQPFVTPSPPPLMTPPAPSMPLATQPAELPPTITVPPERKLSSGQLSAEAPAAGETVSAPPARYAEVPPRPDGGSTMRRRIGARTIAIIICLLVALVGGGSLAFTLSSKPHTTQTTMQPTNTSIPTITFAPTPDPLAPYTAAIPGPGASCDQGSGLWVEDGDRATFWSCSDRGLMLFQASHSQNLAELFFNGPRIPYSFPPNYRISVDVSNLTDGTCVAVLTHLQSVGLGGYGFFVCRDGSWEIVRYDNESNTSLESGNVTPGSSFHLEVSTHFTAQSMFIDTSGPFFATDSAYPTTHAIALAVYGKGQGGASAIFRNFVYTPLGNFVYTPLT
jgi:serine/threonine protein kinase